MYVDQYTIMAIMCALGGCLIRYSSMWKKGVPIKFGYLISDAFTAMFIGYLTYWLIVEHVTLKPSHVCLLCCIVGNLGSRVFDFIAWYAHKKYGIPNFKFGEETNGTDAERSKK